MREREREDREKRTHLLKSKREFKWMPFGFGSWL
jgi:hypothetical protein